MRNLTVLSMITLLLVGANTFAQISTPAPSPTATFSTQVGLTDVEIEYSRPSKKGRTIYGGLVPYDALWRTGANASTKISFSDDVELGGNKVPAGKYALFTKPGKESWEIVLHKNLTVNVPAGDDYNPDNDLVRFSVKPSTIAETIETFTIEIADNQMDAASLVLVWENTRVSIPLKVDVDGKVMASIKNTFEPGGSQYYRAASYYHDAGKDLNQALSYINTALEKYEKDGSKPFWVYRRKALIQADLGKYKEAIATAETSKTLAQEAGNDDYVRMNTASIEDWKKKK